MAQLELDLICFFLNHISSPEDKTPSYAIFKIVQERQKTDSNIQ